MSARRTPPRSRRRPAAIAAFTLTQAVAAVFFVGDATADFADTGPAPHTLFEFFVALALMLGVVFGALELRRSLERLRAQDATIAAAQGAFAEVIAAQFDRWGLTPAEREVAMLALKGFDGAEIAKMRGSAQGTVRAQMASVYAKSGLSGRGQFAAHFVEDLLGDGLLRDSAA